MARSGITVYDLLISCPGDLSELVLAVRDVIDMFNGGQGINNKVMFQAKYWKNDGHPAFGGNPQRVLNEQFVRDCDLAVACFWTRFGTPTDEYLSGTEAEIELMLSQGKQVFLYFFNDPIKVTELDTAQYQKVQNFQRKYQDKGFYRCISQTEFRAQFLNHLSLYFFRELQNRVEDDLITLHSDNYVKKKL